MRLVDLNNVILSSVTLFHAKTVLAPSLICLSSFFRFQIITRNLNFLNTNHCNLSYVWKQGLAVSATFDTCCVRFTSFVNAYNILDCCKMKRRHGVHYLVRLPTPFRRIFSMAITNSCATGRELPRTKNQSKYIHGNSPGDRIYGQTAKPHKANPHYYKNCSLDFLFHCLKY